MTDYNCATSFMAHRAELEQTTGISYTCYEEFSKSVIAGSQLPMEWVAHNKRDYSGPMLLGATSGTTGQLKCIKVALKSRNDSVSPSEHNLIVNFRTHGVFCPGDVVGNLFTINLFSSLHYSACEILKNCKSSVIPVGDISLLGQTHFDYLNDVGLTVLFGVPTTIIQFVEHMERLGRSIPIDKVVFTGEPMLPAHTKYLRRRLGDELQIFGLYGLSECGFIGMSLKDDPNCYQLFDEDYFFEYTSDDGLLATSLDDQSTSTLIRYPIGDFGDLTLSNGKLYFKNIRRKPIEFNFMGNLISHELVASRINAIARIPTIQIVLSLTDELQELMTIKLCAEQLDHNVLANIERNVSEIPEIFEAYMKNRGRISVVVVSLNDFEYSARGKLLLVCDKRITK
ncbi:AMP-binding protein [Vibrio spartinae]|uniref:AMP-binding enzyme n=1 Tax=Vibrio spartinae TaxID=1918945 RepID=A0A1N6M5P2_9VIBR|nr:AMP-binding protein [Vibrio spartinae]SIO94759.1 AMP-binding enzyme [Vibrio spartinae]